MSWIEEELKRRAQMINQELEGYFAAIEHYPQVTHQAMKYSVLAGGKRLRPILVLAVAEILGRKPETVLPAALAVEFIHTYSLIHDDLPAMDNDDLRRGNPTCHIVFGEAAAILAGDALLTLAFEALSKSAEVPEAPSAQIILRVIQEIAEAAGASGLIAGQQVDLESEGKIIQPETLRYIHQNKTGALIRAAVRSGALLSEATDEELEQLTGYAEEFGLAFQIADDILDLIGDEKILGKPVGSDSRNQKSTYPTLFGLTQSQEMAQASANKALEFLDIFGNRAIFLQKLVQYVVTREA